MDLTMPLYSHITLCRIFSVQQCLNGSPFNRETFLNEKHIELVGETEEKIVIKDKPDFTDIRL